MCLLSLAFNAHPDFPLVFVGNRDEYHARPTAPADWWDDAPDILGGRDLQAGGTWLAINKAGRLGVVTNRPDLPAPEQDSSSRGELITGWLNHSTVINKLPEQHSRYGGFSLLLTEPGALQLISGGNGAPKLLTHSLGNEIIGLSNTAPDQPWPKLTWLNQQVAAHLHKLAAGKPDTEHLMALLTRTDPVPQTAVHGVPATPFVTGQQYGTRCSTVVTISRQGECRFIERRFGPGGTQAGESTYSFKLET
jgi:uncharacterized protein with NRDE domain